MTVTEYKCKKCGITISGDFKKSDFWNLDHLQLKFAEIFLKNRGNIKDVEKELGVSYPSVKKLLDNLVSSLTKGGSREETRTPKVVFSHHDGLSVVDTEIDPHDFREEGSKEEGSKEEDRKEESKKE